MSFWDTVNDFAETPPHTWRKFFATMIDLLAKRNTSTYVEKMATQKLCTNRTQKHLHIRGENLFVPIFLISKVETPPHTWRKFYPCPNAESSQRNTSTYVEKILAQYARTLREGKHLHIRGENLLKLTRKAPVEETPPHTWRKFNENEDDFLNFRNTSTYVEKIYCWTYFSRANRNTSTYVEKIDESS